MDDIRGLVYYLGDVARSFACISFEFHVPQSPSTLCFCIPFFSPSHVSIGEELF